VIGVIVGIYSYTHEVGFSDVNFEHSPVSWSLKFESFNVLPSFAISRSGDRELLR